MRTVRRYLPGGRDPAGAAASSRCPGEGGGHPERGPAVQLRALRQALWYQADGRQHARQAFRPLDVRRRGPAAADVRRLPGGGHDGKQDRNDDLRLSESVSGAQPLNFVLTLPPEEVARANFYGLLARLFYAPPDAALLETLAGAEGIDAEDGGIGAAWEALRDAAAQTDAGTVHQEYDDVFVGTGKAPVTLYTTAYSI